MDYDLDVGEDRLAGRLLILFDQLKRSENNARF